MPLDKSRLNSDPSGNPGIDKGQDCADTVNPLFTRHQAMYADWLASTPWFLRPIFAHINRRFLIMDKLLMNLTASNTDLSGTVATLVTTVNGALSQVTALLQSLATSETPNADVTQAISDLNTLNNTVATFAAGLPAPAAVAAPVDPTAPVAPVAPVDPSAPADPSTPVEPSAPASAN